MVAADGLTIDLNGHSVLGLRKERTAGIRIYGFKDVIVNNGTIAGFERGLYLYNTKSFPANTETISAGVKMSRLILLAAAISGA